MVIHPPDYRLRVFISSTLKELAEERKAVRQAVRKLRLAPVMFESGARPHPAQKLYQSYLSQSQIFIGIYWQSYGWVGPEAHISGLEDEYNLSANIPRLIYIKKPSPDREPALETMLNRIRNDNTSSYTYFSTITQLKELVQNDLAVLLSERFELMHPKEESAADVRPRPLTNVPIPRNPLIGRERLIKTVCELLCRDDIALITLTGAGGTGKSRLAIQVGLEMIDHFKDGIYMVMLEPIRDPSLVISTIAETLGIHEFPGGQPIREQLKEHLHDKQMLLLLDNFEQVVEAAPDVAEILETCPQVKCLVSSRSPLRLRAERVLPVPPLLAPSLEELTHVSNLSQYAAVELFIQRAQSVKPDFAVTNANAPAVAEICYRLDGLPLAIELAAARIKLLTPQGLLTRLEHRFDILHGGTRDLPERQRTLRSAIDWSYDLLNEEEKKLFRRLSIFIGGWTLEAAETVCEINGDLGPNLDDILGGLIDNNLVLQLQETEDQPRFGMLSTIHEYAFERLNDTDEAETIHCQHAEYYLNFVVNVEPLIRSAERVRWLEVMLQEFGNIRAVLAWTYTSKNCIDIGQQIVISIGMFWQFSGYIAEGRQWCGHMLGLCDGLTPISIRAGLLSVIGEIAWTQGDLFFAIEKLDESMELSRELGDKRLSGFAMLVRGMVAATIRDLPIATSMLQNSVDLFTSTKDLWYKALALSWLGEVALFENDLDGAMTFCKLSMDLAVQQGDLWCKMPSVMTVGQIGILQGDLSKARSAFQEAVDLLRLVEDNWSLSWALNNLGHVMLMQGELSLAKPYFLEAISRAKRMGNQGVMIISLVGIASLISRRSITTPNIDSQDRLELVLAAHLCGATVPLLNNPGIFAWADSKIHYDSAIQQVQSGMEANLWDQAFSEGQAIPLDHAVGLAMQALEGNSRSN